METAARKSQDNSARTASYRVVTTLGSGGTALVHLAVAERSAGFQKLVVLKALLPHLANEASVSEMFRNEARIAARLKHPNVVEVYEVFDDLDQPVLVMEYLRGASLRELIKATSSAEPIPLRHHLDVIRQACRGIHHCHELRDFDGTPMHFIHRDVSPHNIYVTFEGEVRLLDFGIAKVQGHDGGTQTGLLKGKIRYMAPEQMMGGQLDRRADIYAIGVVLWEAISGKEMWGNVTEGMILHKTVNGDIPPLEAPEDCPQELIEITQRCLAVAREGRFETAEQIADALDLVLRKLPDPQRRLGQVVHALFSGRDNQVNALVRSALEQSEGVATFEGGVVDWGDSFSDSRTNTLLDSRHLVSRATRRQVTSHEVGSAHRWRWSLIGGTLAFLLAGTVFALKPTTPASASLVAVPSATLSLRPAVDVATSQALASLAVRANQETSTDRAAQEIRIRVGTTPSAASLYLDGELIGNPSLIARPSDGSVHTFRASARGYDDLEQQVSFDADQEIDLKLVKGRAATRRPSSASPHIEPATAAPSPPVAEDPPSEPPSSKTDRVLADDDCKSEYVVREDGLLGLKQPNSKACGLLKGK